MKKQRKARANRSAKSFRRLSLTVAVLTACLAIGAITVVSRQSVTEKTSKEPITRSVSTSVANKKYVTVKVAGQDIQVDGQTGQIKPLTPQEAQQLAEGLKVMLNKSTDGLVQIQHPDGSTSMDLEGRFQNVTVARENEDGTVSRSCVDNPRAAAAFFEIDPKLLGVESTGIEPAKPARKIPARNNIQ